MELITNFHLWNRINPEHPKCAAGKIGESVLFVKSENCFDKTVHRVIMELSHFPEDMFGQLVIRWWNGFSTRIGMVEALSGGALDRD